MKTKIFLSVLGVLGLCLAVMPAQAQWGVDSHYSKNSSKIGINYFLFEKLSLGARMGWIENPTIEVKDITGKFKKVNTITQHYGVTGYYCPVRISRVVGLFTTIQGDYLRFKDEEASGDGFGITAGIGAEFKTNEWFGISAQVNECWLTLKDEKTKVRVSQSNFEDLEIGFRLYF